MAKPKPPRGNAALAKYIVDVATWRLVVTPFTVYVSRLSITPVAIRMHPFIETQKEWIREVPAFRAGDTLRVNVRVREGDKERLQAFEGVCIARRGAGVSETFTVRKISNGVGVERIFPVHSPMLESIGIVRRGRVRRAKLFYLRGVTGKSARIKEKRVRVVVPETVAKEVAE